jgi:hypothetical protein
MTRALLALGPEIMPRSGHGLQFVGAKTLLATKATLSRGTFTDYLSAFGLPWKEGDEITLAEALGFIVELWTGYNSLDELTSFVQRVHIQAMMSGKVRLVFDGYRGNFADEWQSSFPDLTEVCVWEAENTLLVKNTELGKKYDDVSLFARKHFLPLLILQSGATWNKLRIDKNVLTLNRVSYYYIAMFILGSVVRYEPELMLGVNSPDSLLGWTLKRFIGLSERFFPQLKLMEFHQTELYFSGYTI